MTAGDGFQRICQPIKRTWLPTVSAEQLIGMRMHGVSVSYIEAVKSRSARNLSLDDLSGMRMRKPELSHHIAMTYPQMIAGQVCLKEGENHGTDFAAEVYGEEPRYLIEILKPSADDFHLSAPFLRMKQ